MSFIESIKSRNSNPVYLKIKKIMGVILAHMWLIGAILVVLIPLMWMINAAFYKGNGVGVSELRNVSIIPKFSDYSLVHFNELFSYKTKSDAVFSDFLTSFFTTFKVAIVSMVLIVVNSSLVGFALSRYKFKGKKATLLTLMGLQLFPSFMGMLAIFLLFQTFSLLNKPLALALIYTAGSIPYNAFIVRGFMRNIPKSLDEAAAIDGASNFQILYKIILPLAVPIIGFIAVSAFMAPWLDYILPSVLLSNNKTVAILLMQYTDPNNNAYNALNFFAGAIFLAVPIMIVQIYMQKYVVGGLTAGADKG